MKNNHKIIIRAYQEKDAPYLAEIYFNTIHHINSRDYSPEAIDAWAPASALETAGWIKKWHALPPFVAITDDQIVGFAEFEKNGHIDCFYCHHDYQGCGVGSSLMKAIEDKANQLGIKRLFAEVSITAKPFFIAKGFNTVKEQSVIRQGVALKNTVMEKILE